MLHFAFSSHPPPNTKKISSHGKMAHAKVSEKLDVLDYCLNMFDIVRN